MASSNKITQKTTFKNTSCPPVAPLLLMASWVSVLANFGERWFYTIWTRQDSWYGTLVLNTINKNMFKSLQSCKLDFCMPWDKLILTRSLDHKQLVVLYKHQITCLSIIRCYQKLIFFI